MATTNWAADDDVAYDGMYDDRRSDAYDDEDQSLNEEDGYYAEEALWEKAQDEVVVETDAEGRKYEICKKVLRRHVDRPIEPADIRAGFARFGKAVTSKQSDLVSKEPPLVLELGTVDSFERESRNEVKRMIYEASSVDVQVRDATLAKIDQEERVRRNLAAARGTTSSTTGGGETWGSSNRNTRTTTKDEDVPRRIRVTNISDAITEDHLRAIFGANGRKVERVFLARDQVTGQAKGFAFVTFQEAYMAEEAIKMGKVPFKNVVMSISRAVDKSQ